MPINFVAGRSMDDLEWAVQVGLEVEFAGYLHALEKLGPTGTNVLGVPPEPCGMAGALAILGQLDELLADAEQRSMKVFRAGRLAQSARSETTYAAR